MSPPLAFFKKSRYTTLDLFLKSTHYIILARRLRLLQPLHKLFSSFIFFFFKIPSSMTSSCHGHLPTFDLKLITDKDVTFTTKAGLLYFSQGLPNCSTRQYVCSIVLVVAAACFFFRVQSYTCVLHQCVCVPKRPPCHTLATYSKTRRPPHIRMLLLGKQAAAVVTKDFLISTLFVFSNISVPETKEQSIPYHPPLLIHTITQRVRPEKKVQKLVKK